MLKIGKIGKINILANRYIKSMFLSLGICFCEVCGTDYMLTFAHRHKRVWYRSCPELLHHITHVLLLCAKCHAAIEYDKDGTEKLFMKLRGAEVCK